MCSRSIRWNVFSASSVACCGAVPRAPRLADFLFPGPVVGLVTLRGRGLAGRFGLVQLRLDLGAVEHHEQVGLLHLVALAHGDRRDATGDLRRDADEAALHLPLDDLGGRLRQFPRPPPQAAHDGRDDEKGEGEADGFHDARADRGVEVHRVTGLPVARTLLEPCALSAGLEQVGKRDIELVGGGQPFEFDA